MMFLMQFFIMLHTAHYHNVFFCMNAVWYTVRHDPEVLKYAKHYLETRFDNTFSLHYYRQTGRDIFYRVIELLKQQGHVSNDRTTLVFESGETLSLKDKIILQLKDGRVSCSSTSTVFKDVAANMGCAPHVHFQRRSHGGIVLEHCTHPAVPIPKIDDCHFFLFGSAFIRPCI